MGREATKQRRKRLNQRRRHPHEGKRSNKGLGSMSLDMCLRKSTASNCRSAAQLSRPTTAPKMRGVSCSSRSVTYMVGRKVNTVDKEWTKGLGSVGYFVEDKEKKSFSLLGRLSDRKVLSSVEKSGLLSTAEKAGLTLSKVESLKLLSTAEKLGILGFLESTFEKDGATITSYSIPFFLLALLSLVVIPNDNIPLTVAHYGLTGAFAVAFTFFFASGFVIKSLQEDD